MSKQKVLQRYILKLNSERLRKSNWNLTISLPEARNNDEVISIGDSQMMRWIDELHGVKDADSEARKVRSEIKRVRNKPSSVSNQREIKKLYESLDALQFQPDYLSLVVNRVTDYRRACEGFTVNGIRYVRLLGTSGGVKQSTIIFINEVIATEIRRRIDNGRNESIPLVPAKFEAYRALTCSGSTAVSMPKGIIIVKDCETHFFEDVTRIRFVDTEEPELFRDSNYRIDLSCTDGCGMILPELAKRWSEELSLHYECSGFNTRFAWEKGMVFPFDFREFANSVAGKTTVLDAWGDERDVMDAEMILTTSMVKLWNCYDSMEDYLQKCSENKYEFGVTKTAPEVLEEERTTNYQFLASYDLTDEQIDKLIEPTVRELSDVLSEDYQKAILFMCGKGLDDHNVLSSTPLSLGLMTDPRLYNDTYVRHMLLTNVKNRINDAKIGVLKTHANYSIISGDLYALCEHIFGMPVKGLLKSGELYNQYWYDYGATDVVTFRAPMSTHENIRRLTVSRDAMVLYWYRYIKTCTIVNAWDSSTTAWNGADFDGDILFITDNEVLLNAHIPMPTIVCEQSNAEKIKVTEQDLIESNIKGFGDGIGKITNRITSMYDILAGFDPDSDEYKTLMYRIQCGEMLQQNEIDKIFVTSYSNVCRSEVNLDN